LDSIKFRSSLSGAPPHESDAATPPRPNISERIGRLDKQSESERGVPLAGQVGAPGKTSAEIVDKLNKEINACLTDPQLKTQLADLGGIILSGSPADFGRFVANDIEKWGKVVKFAGIKAD